MKNLDKEVKEMFGEMLNRINSHKADLEDEIWEIEDDELSEAMQEYVDAIDNAESEIFKILKKKKIALPYLEWI